MSTPSTEPGAPTLVFVPTELEHRRLADLGGLDARLARSVIVGFGPVAAAARASQAIARHRPRRALLLGIAGTFAPDRCPVGEAALFSRVAIDGVGAGEGDGFRPPSGLGFPQWPGSDDSEGGPVGEELPLARPPGTPATLLLSTCAASAGAVQTARRRARFPDALAEDMEAFGVALACALAGVPLCVVRGMSNVVGERDPARWSIPAALAAARRRAEEVLAGPAWVLGEPGDAEAGR